MSSNHAYRAAECRNFRAGGHYFVKVESIPTDDKCVPHPLHITPCRFASARRYHGVAMIYLTVVMVAAIGLVSLGVDLARVQAAKTELQRATDAAARYGASGLKNSLNGSSAAADNAAAAAYDNTVDTEPLVLDKTSEVILGVWANSTFTANSDPSLANAVKVDVQRQIPLMFGRVLGQTTCNIHVKSIAQVSGATQVTVSVPATSNPFLAGMPAGSVASLNNPHSNPDYANGTTGKPNSSPVQASGVTISAGSTLTFDGVNGGATNDYNDSNRYTADGNTDWVTGNTNGAENGISDLMAPGNSLVGVFLTDDEPDLTPAPSRLDFSTTVARDFSTLRPQLKQLFFIGDGRRDSGEVQQFVVPSGATRLYLGTWDSYEWNNNIGTFTMTLHNKGAVSLVK